MSSAPVSCTNCHQVCSADGKISWVCDNCLFINPSPTNPITPNKPTSDIYSAQPVIDSAAAEAIKKSVVK